MTPKSIAQMIVVWTLLVLYVGIASFMIFRVFECGQSPSCTTVSFGNGALWLLTGIGGLVSGVVVARLGVATEIGSFHIVEPAPVVNRSRPARGRSSSPDLISWTYVGVWFIVGLAALLVGMLWYPDVNQSVSNIGTAWAGVALGAGASYFGIGHGQTAQVTSTSTAPI